MFEEILEKDLQISFLKNSFYLVDFNRLIFESSKFQFHKLNRIIKSHLQKKKWNIYIIFNFTEKNNFYQKKKKKKKQTSRNAHRETRGAQLMRT